MARRHPTGNRRPSACGRTDLTGPPDESSGAFSIGGESWLEAGGYDLRSADGTTGALLVHKQLVGYEIHF